MSHFPCLAKGPYVAHAGVAPLCTAAAQAVTQWTERSAERCQETGWVWQQLNVCREQAAQLIGAQASDISLIGPTTYGIAQVANGWPWQSGDDILYYAEDYPANVYPWDHLRQRGLSVRSLKPERPGVITWDLIEAALRPETRLVALASCHYLSGYRIDIDTIGRELQQRDIRFSLDAIQTLGAFPTKVDYVDFLSADGHKWLMAPGGAGFFYTAPDYREQLEPLARGSWNVKSPEFVAQPEQHLETDGRRFECGTLNLPGLVGLQASLHFFNQLGVDEIAHQLLTLRRHILTALRPHGWTSIHGDAEDDAQAHTWQSGILSLQHPTRDLAKDFQQLKGQGMLSSLRQDQQGRSWLRLSPHGYMTTADLDPLIEYLIQ